MGRETLQWLKKKKSNDSSSNNPKPNPPLLNNESSTSDPRTFEVRKNLTENDYKTKNEKKKLVISLPINVFN